MLSKVGVTRVANPNFMPTTSAQFGLYENGLAIMCVCVYGTLLEKETSTLKA